MTIQTYFNNSPTNKIGKTLTTGPAYTGEPRENTNIIHPEIRIDGIVDPKINYAYIAEFGRYYFIDEITWEGQNVYTLHMSTDPLETYKTEILANTCLVGRTDGDPNNYLTDDLRPVQANFDVITSALDDEVGNFNTVSAIMATIDLDTITASSSGTST